MSRFPDQRLDGMGVTTQSKYLQRASAFALLGNDIGYQWEDFYQIPAPGGSISGWTATIVSTGTISATTANERHSFRLSSGTTASSTAQLRNNSNQDIVSGSVDKWYYATRIRVNTAVTAQSQAYTGLWDGAGANSIALGVLGNLSTANYIVQHSGIEAGSFINLAVAIDTNFHVIEAWGQGSTTLFAQIDNGGVISATQGAALTNAGPVVVVRNGTDVVNRSMSIDWLLLATGRS